MSLQVKVVKRGDEYRYECGRTVNGIYWLAIGCHHLIPSEAHRHADRLEEPYVSPLRSGEATPANTGPLPVDDAVASPETRRRVSPVRTAGR